MRRCQPRLQPGGNPSSPMPALPCRSALCGQLVRCSRLHGSWKKQQKHTSQHMGKTLHHVARCANFM